VGIKIKTLLPRTAHDKDAAAVINRLVNDSNNEARQYIMVSMRNLITVGKTIKSLLDDNQKKAPEMIINWKEVEHASDENLYKLGVDAYKKIHLFATLMQIAMSSSN
ncbi:MAG: hypothetical protein IKI31_05135, partial [Treponema sp.]|nr:hypothetical protein [Treponema sp.]